LDASGHEVPVPLAELGIPERPDLANDSTVVPWFARRWPETLPDSRPMRLRLAMADGTASTGWLAVYVNPIQQQPFAAPAGPPPPARGEVPRPPPSPPEDSLVAGSRAAGAAASRPGLRVLYGTPLGDGPALVFETTSRADVRVDVFDLQGRRLVTLADGAFP